MFNNTRDRVTSTSYTENGEQFPFISNIDYIKDTNNKRLLDNIYYLNEKDSYYIKIDFNKEVIVSENTILRVLFNNNSYIEREVSSGAYKHLLVEGDNTIHFEEELKVVDVEVVNGYIKDEFNHILNTKIKKEIIDKQTSLFVLNNKPVVDASSEKSIYTNNIASILINTNEEFVSSYCISENSNCDYNEYIEFTTNKVEYEFDTENANKNLCVFIKDKAGNVSECANVSFDYFSLSKVDLKIEEGQVLNSNSVNVVIEVEETTSLNLTEYCLIINDSECEKKAFSNKINEKLVIPNIEGNNAIKLILFDSKGNTFECVKKYTLDKTNPKLDFKITNSDKISNYKDVVINFTDNHLLNKDNKYEYYLSSSDSVLTGSSWVSFENSQPFRIRNVFDGDYYLWIRNVKDEAGNSYSNDEYILISEKLSFDNSKPQINIVSSNQPISNTNLTKEFIITYTDNNKVKDTILDKSSLVINCTNNAKYKINIKNSISNGWVVEVTFENENLASGYFSLTVLSNLVEDVAGNRNDPVTSNLIKIN